MSRTPYEEYITGAADVCSNCLRLCRVERVDPVRGFGQEFEASLERRRETTTVAFGPAESVSEQKGVFCNCGVEGARDRIWDGADVDDDRFRELLQHCLTTLETKDVTVPHERTAAIALQAFKDGADPDDALSTALDIGLAAAATPAASVD
jgi:hypothetical protein